MTSLLAGGDVNQPPVILRCAPHVPNQIGDRVSGVRTVFTVCPNIRSHLPTSGIPLPCHTDIPDRKRFL